MRWLVDLAGSRLRLAGFVRYTAFRIDAVALIFLLSDQHRLSYHQHIHTSAKETIERLLRLTHHRFILVKRGVEHHRNAGEFAVGPDQSMISRVGAPIDRLQPTRSVDMSDSGDQWPLVLADLEDLHHEGNVIVLLEPIRHCLFEHRGRERTEGFPSLDLSVQNGFHVRSARIADNGAVAERTGTP